MVSPRDSLLIHAAGESAAGLAYVSRDAASIDASRLTDDDSPAAAAHASGRTVAHASHAHACTHHHTHFGTHQHAHLGLHHSKAHQTEHFI